MAKQASAKQAAAIPPASPGMLLVQTLLYSAGPFFTYPWKPLLNVVAGDSYAVGYKHFRNDHTDPLNLGLHVVCLFFQVTGNFGFLWHLDDALLQHQPTAVLGAWRALSASSLVVWSLALALSPASFSCTALSVTCLVGAFLGAPWLAAHGPELEAAMLILFLAVLAAASVLVKDPKRHVPFTQWMPSAGFFFVVWVTSSRTLTKLFGGELRALAPQANAVQAVVMVLAASRPDPVTVSVIAGALLSRANAILTGQPAVFFYGLAFFAMALQGLAHHFGREAGTLPRLQSGKDRHAKIRYEMSHVVYFPNLLLSACAEALAGKVPTKVANTASPTGYPTKGD